MSQQGISTWINRTTIFQEVAKQYRVVKKSLLPRVIAKNILFYPVYKRTVITEYKCSRINLNAITERTNCLKELGR